MTEIEELAKIFKPYLDNEGRDANDENALAKLVIDAGYRKSPEPPKGIVWPEKAGDNDFTESFVMGYNACHEAFMTKIKELGI